MYNKISNPTDSYARSENKQDNHVFTICCVAYLEIIIIFDILIFYI